MIPPGLAEDAEAPRLETRRWSVPLQTLEHRKPGPENRDIPDEGLSRKPEPPLHFGRAACCGIIGGGFAVTGREWRIGCRAPRKIAQIGLSPRVSSFSSSRTFRPERRRRSVSGPRNACLVFTGVTNKDVRAAIMNTLQRPALGGMSCGLTVGAQAGHKRKWLLYLIDKAAKYRVRRGGLEPPRDCSR